MVRQDIRFALQRSSLMNVTRYTHGPMIGSVVFYNGLLRKVGTESLPHGLEP